MQPHRCLCPPGRCGRTRQAFPCLSCWTGPAGASARGSQRQSRRQLSLCKVGGRKESKSPSLHPHSAHMQAQTHMYTHVHTCTHTTMHMCTHMHRCMNPAPLTYLHTCTHAHMRTQTHARLARCTGQLHHTQDPGYRGHLAVQRGLLGRGLHADRRRVSPGGGSPQRPVQPILPEVPFFPVQPQPLPSHTGLVSATVSATIAQEEWPHSSHLFPMPGQLAALSSWAQRPEPPTNLSVAVPKEALVSTMCTEEELAPQVT